MTLLTTAKFQHLMEEGYLRLSPGEANISQDRLSRAKKVADILSTSRTPDLSGWYEITQNIYDDTVGLISNEVTELISNILSSTTLIIGKNAQDIRATAQLACQSEFSRSPNYHVDGYPDEALGRGVFLPFDLLLGILLHNTPEHNGCFSYIPRSHIKVHGKSVKSVVLHENKPGISIKKSVEYLAPRLAGNAVSMSGYAGDIILLHPFTIHGTLSNISNVTRKMVFFRISHPRTPQELPLADTKLLELWRAWDGIQAL